jgi:L,D-peptidoglycan transpeptidase YkuD (ErfK/YbiS/YcfS/YnhG family)
VKRILVLPALLAVGLAAAASPGRGGGTACAPNVANRLASTGASTQLVTVVAATPSSTRGTVRLWERRGECWVAAERPWTAWLGGRGVSENRHEGDRTTPAGVFGFGTVMYGLGPNPGVRYPYRRVRCGDWWVEDARSPFYNQFRRTPCGSKTPFKTVGGDLSESPTAYRHFAFIRFNTDPVVPGRGSGIFLHATTGRPTLGCVSLPLAQLVTGLRWLRPAAEPLIAIGTSAMLSRR